MAVGMTLHQLYAQTATQQQAPPHQTYDDHHAMNNSADNSAVSGPAPQQQQQQQQHQSQHMRSKSPDKAAPSAVHYEPSNNVHHSHSHSHHQHHPHAAYQVAPSHYQAPPQQQQAHYGYSNQYQSKSADDYAADPLPFEYHGVRKYTDTYAPHHHVPQYSMSKPLDSRQPQAHGTYAPHYAPHLSDRSHYHPASEISAHFPHASHHHHHHHHHSSSSSSNAHMFGSQLPLTHSFPPLIDPKKEVPTTSTASSVSATAPTVVVSADAVYAPPQSSSASTAASQAIAAAVSAHSEYHQANGTSGVQSASTASSSVPSVVSSGAAQEAMIKVKTPLKTKYWRNGRRNLQCFPSCKVFGDYSAIKIEDLKQHDFMWGKCRGSIVTEVTLNSSVSFDDIVILGRVHSLENIPVAFEEAVIRECMLGRMVEPDVMDAMKDQWISGERLPDFVQHDGHTACFEFKPKVWKYTEDMAQGKCKRRNVKYYVQFEAFVLVMAGERRYYACIGSGMSTSFEVGSSRVLARQKRKAATTTTGELKHNGAASGSSGHQDAASTMQPMHHAMMAPHGMLSTGAPAPPLSHHHSMAPSGMFQTQFHHAHLSQQQHTSAGMHESMGGASRGLPAFQQMAPPLQTQQLHASMALESAHGVAPVAPVAGTKRKASSDRQAFPTERAPKQHKAMPSSM